MLCTIDCEFAASLHSSETCGVHRSINFRTREEYPMGNDRHAYLINWVKFFSHCLVCGDVLSNCYQAAVVNPFYIGSDKNNKV